MSELIIIEKGDEVESDTLNFNFQCLDEKVVSTNQRIETVSASIKSVQSTLNAQLASVSSSILTTLETIYPVGSIYVGTTNMCPLANLFGTWEKVAEGLCLQGATGSQVPGETVEAGLPNPGYFYSPWNETGGAFKGEDVGNANIEPEGNSAFRKTKITLKNSIYKDDCDTVQPPAYLVNIWKRTA